MRVFGTLNAATGHYLSHHLSATFWTTKHSSGIHSRDVRLHLLYIRKCSLFRDPFLAPYRWSWVHLKPVKSRSIPLGWNRSPNFWRTKNRHNGLPFKLQLFCWRIIKRQLQLGWFRFMRWSSVVPTASCASRFQRHARLPSPILSPLYPVRSHALTIPLTWNQQISDK